jgi:hypothetical protein
MADIQPLTPEQLERIVQLALGYCIATKSKNYSGATRCLAELQVFVEPLLEEKTEGK